MAGSVEPTHEIPALKSTIDRLRERQAELEAELATLRNGMPAEPNPTPVGRRGLMAGGGLGALGLLAMAGQGRAAASTSDSEPDLGNDSGPWDVWADGLAFVTEDINSATTVTSPVVRYDCSVSGFTITIGNELEGPSGFAQCVVLIDETNSAGTNQVTIDTQSGNNIDGGSSITVNHSGAVTILFWDSGEWRSTRFIDTVDAGQIFNDNYVEPQVTASEGTSYDADLTAGNYHKVTMTGDVTFDFTNPDGSEVNSLVLQIVQDGTGNRSPSFTPTVVWDGGSAPSWSTGANEEDIVTFIHDQDGSQWIGMVGGLTLA